MRIMSKLEEMMTKNSVIRFAIQSSSSARSCREKQKSSTSLAVCHDDTLHLDEGKYDQKTSLWSNEDVVREFSFFTIYIDLFTKDRSFFARRKQQIKLEWTIRKKLLHSFLLSYCKRCLTVSYKISHPIIHLENWPVRCYSQMAPILGHWCCFWSVERQVRLWPVSWSPQSLWFQGIVYCVSFHGMYSKEVGGPEKGEATALSD